MLSQPDLLPLECSAHELARVLGKSVNHVNKITAAGVLSRSSRGKFDLASSIQRYVKHTTDNLRAKYSITGESKARVSAARAKLLELELAVRQEQLLPVDEAIRVYSNEIERAKTRLQMIPSKLAPRLLAAKTLAAATALLESEIYSALSELSKCGQADDEGKT